MRYIIRIIQLRKWASFHTIVLETKPWPAAQFHIPQPSTAILHIIQTVFHPYRKPPTINPPYILLPGNDKQHTADPGAGQEHIHPDVRRQGIKEGEDARISAVGFTVQDTDAEGHKGLGEVNHFLPDVGDGQRSHGQICYLEGER